MLDELADGAIADINGVKETSRLVTDNSEFLAAGGSEQGIRANEETVYKRNLADIPPRFEGYSPLELLVNHPRVAVLNQSPCFDRLSMAQARTTLASRGD